MEDFKEYYASMSYKRIPRDPFLSCELGKFVVTGTRTAIMEERSNEEIGLYWSNSIPGLPHSRLVDSSHNMFVEMFDQTFEERVAEIRRIHHLDWLETKQMGVYPRSGALEQEIHFVPDIFRSILRSMTLFLVSLHDKNCHTEGFSQENLVFEGENLKFYNVRISKAVDAKMDDKVNKDFGYMAMIVRRIFSSRFEVLPPELHIWIDTLVTATRESTEFLVDNVATLSTLDREYFVRKIVEKKTGMWIVSRVLNSVVPSSYRENWWEEIKNSNGALMQTLMYKNRVDQNGQVVNAYKRNDIRQLLRFCRNFSVHGREYGQVVDPVKDFDEEDIDAMLFYKFGEELSNLQSAINESSEVRRQFKFSRAR